MPSDWPKCATYPGLGCVCRGAFMANPTSGSCIRKKTGDLTSIDQAGRDEEQQHG